jgi:hypothetical protein
MGAPLTLFFFPLEGAILIGPSLIFLGHWGNSTIKAPLWTPSCKIEINNVLPLQHTPFEVIYMGVEFWAKKTIWDKTEVLLLKTS